MNISNDDFIRTTEPRHIASSQALWQALEKRGDIYLGSFAGWYSVRDEAFYDESELVDGKAPTGAEVEWVEEENYLLPPLGLAGPAARVLRGQSRLHRAAQPAQRGHQLRQRRAERPLDLAHQLQLGHPGAGRPDARHVCLARRAHQLHHRGRLSRHRNAKRLQTFWPADLHMVGKDILRFHAVYWPAFLMAAGPRAAAPRLRPWLVDGRGPEDVEIARQLHPAGAARRAIRRRRRALFHAARTAVRQRRRFLAPRHDRPASTAISPMVSAIWRSACCR